MLGSSESEDWFTPQHVLELVERVLGGIDLDPSWHPDCLVRARRTLTKTQDGLARPWRGRVFLNPRYGRTVDTWICKLVEEHAAGLVTEAIALTTARTDAEWFARLDAFPRCFIRRHLPFGTPAGFVGPAPFPSAAFYLGPRLGRFAAVFAQLGPIFVQYDVEESRAVVKPPAKAA